jgi:hypothetical protein
MPSIAQSRPCPHEDEVLELARTGRWPARAADDLRDHVAACEACAEVALVADALGAEWDVAVREAAPPDGRRVWWQAQRRARIEAARTAARPAGWAHLATIAGALALLAWSAWSSAGHVQAWVGRTDASEWVLWLLSGAQGGSTVVALAVLALAAVVALVLAPVALWLALSE